ncbi:periplasmic chaperone for outer membrane proteins SurA [Marinoscillum furvescens DSM 4134]|uniref:Periplasmic chaperone for outer membrane proteins SurA n=2 Tax=Marinoscillum furvescens TaxID=1026 RepID=A0A3D9L612_MARFU|nr:periplasmic chaperone for outer membrane proteins SurA [Marinoscillum furvescens DSM 4134]
MGFLRFLITSGIVLSAFFATAQSSVVVDKIIAKVDNYIVLKSDLERAYLDYLSRGEFRGSNARCTILEQLVVNKMLVAKAEIDSVMVDDMEVQSNLNRRMEYMISQIGSEEEIEKYYNKSLDQIKEDLFDDIKEQMVIQRMQGEITSGIKVSPAEVRRFFNRIPQDSLPFFSTEVRVAQIVKKPTPGVTQKEKVQKLMYEIRGRILKGESFADLARQYSEDPGSAARGGELPFYKRGDLAPEFEATAMTLKEGELSMPVETQFGYHLIELQQKRGNTFKSRHILISPKPSAEDVQGAREYLDSLRTVIQEDSLTFEAAAKEYSDDQATSSSGGFFVDDSESTRVSVETLDPTIFFTLDTMEVGTITRPLEFKQPDGSQAFRILYYKERVPPHQANLKQDYQKIAKATLQDKQNKIMSEWFEDARDKVYIEIDPEYNYCDLLED